MKKLVGIFAVFAAIITMADVPLFKNGDFTEKTTIGLPKFWRVVASDVKNVSVYESDNGNAVKMMPQAKERMFLIQYPTKMVPGTRYRVSYEVKSAKKTQHRVYFDYRDEFNKLRCNDGSWNSTPSEWSEQSFTFLYPNKASGGYLVLNPDSTAGAEVEFRNVRFEVAPDGNVLKNPEFTLRNAKGDLKAWNMIAVKGTSMKAENKVLRLFTGENGKAALAVQWDILIVPGQRYKVSAEVRAKTQGAYRIYGEWRIPDPAAPQSKGRLSSYGGWWRKVGTDWKVEKFEIAFPENCKGAYLILSGKDSEFVEFRNVKVEASDSAAAQAVVPATEVKAATQNAVAAAPAVANVITELAVDGNLVRNPTFAADKNGKLPNWSLISGKMESADGNLRLFTGENGKAALVAQWNINVTAGKSYRVSTEVRANAPGAYRVYCEWRVPDPAAPQSKGRLSSYGGWWRSVDTAWKKDSITVNIPENSRGAYLILSGKTAGSVEFRNVKITEIENLIPKEAELAGGKWKISDTAKFTVKDGKASLTIATNNGKNGVVTLENVKVKPGQRYALNYTIQGQGKAGSDTGFHPFRISVKFAGIRDDGAPWDDTQNGTRNKSIEFTVPQNIVGNRADICFETTTRGAVVFSNLEFKELPPKPVALLTVDLTSPFFRDTLYPGSGENSIAGSVTADSAGADVKLFNAKGQLVASADCVLKNGKGSFKLAAETLPVGDYKLQISATVKGQAVTIDRIISKLAPAASYTAFDGKRFIINGKPFVPVLSWTIAGTSVDRSDEEIERGYYHAARNGINSAIIRVSSCEAALRYLNIAQKYGIKLFLATGNSPSANLNTLALWEHQISGILTDEVIQHPALFGYFLVDEPYWRGIPSNALVASYKILKAIDPRHPVWINAAPRGSVEVHSEYSQAADIYGVDVYPVGSKGHSGLEDKGLSSIGKYVYRMDEACGGHKPIVMALQGFAWGEFTSASVLYPNLDELRFMTYDAITSGGIGASYWGTQGIIKSEFYTDVLYVVTRELQQLSGVLTAEKVADVSCSVADVHIFAREIGGKKYVIAANAADREANAVISGLNNGEMLVVNENRSVAVNGGKFTDRFAPYAVHIYAEGELPVPTYALPARNADFEKRGNTVFSFMKEKLSRVPYNGNASWIWMKGLERQPYSKVFAAREFTVDKAVKSARLIISADDVYNVWLNGKAADTDFPKSGTWDLADVIDVTRFIKDGGNIIAVNGADGGVTPCGVIADLHIIFADGSETHIVTDGSWKANGSAVDNWQTPAVFGKWGSALVVAPYGSGAWGNKMQMKSVSK